MLHFDCPYCFFFVKGRETYIKSWQSTSPNYTWKNLKYKIHNILSRFFYRLLPPMTSIECRSQSAVLMPYLTTNPKTLDMPQDPTLRNQSKMHLNRWKNIGGCIIRCNIGCRFITFKTWFPLRDHRRWDRWPGIIVFVRGSQKTPSPYR